jgi:hypothetical protein
LFFHPLSLTSPKGEERRENYNEKDMKNYLAVGDWLFAFGFLRCQAEPVEAFF